MKIGPFLTEIWPKTLIFWSRDPSETRGCLYWGIYGIYYLSITATHFSFCKDELRVSTYGIPFFFSVSLLRWIATTVFVKRNPPLIHYFSVAPLGEGGQKFTWSIICVGGVNMVNFFGWDICSRFEAVLERVKASLGTEIALFPRTFPKSGNHIAFSIWPNKINQTQRWLLNLVQYAPYIHGIPFSGHWPYEVLQAHPFVFHSGYEQIWKCLSFQSAFHFQHAWYTNIIQCQNVKGPIMTSCIISCGNKLSLPCSSVCPSICLSYHLELDWK